jgi:L-lactate dehydrogenase (cytochrome)
MTGLYWPRGELAMARAAARWSLIYTLSCISSVTLEEVAAETNAPKWFQLYLFEDDRLVMSLVERAAAAGYAALMVTVDTPVVGQRLRDIRSRLSIPPRPTPAFVASMLAHPSWSRPFFLGYRPQAANLAGHPGTAGYRGLPAFKRSARWTDIEAIRQAWPGRLIVKGVMTSDDVRHAAACGADAVVVSNHGGRQLDCSASALAALRAIGSHDCELYLDGGIRSGSDVLKALALGARAVLLGRAPLFGLAAGGEPLASRAIEIIADDLRRAMTLAGCAGADDVGNLMVIDEPAGEYHAGP